MAPIEPQEDDIPTPKQVKGWRIFTVAFLACMGACMFGYNLGVIGGEPSTTPHPLGVK